MTNVLIVVIMADNEHERYGIELRKAFPGLKVDVVDDVAKADPFLADAEILIARGPMLKDETFTRMPKLKWVQGTSAGLDGFLERPTFPPGVILTNITGIQGVPVSEGVISHLLTLTRSVPQFVAQQGEHRWARKMMPLLAGSTAGIYGVGNIAGVLAPRLKALEMNVVGFSSAPREVEGFDRIFHRDAFDAEVGKLDYLLLLAPLTDATRDFANASLFARMKPSAFLINFARGGLVVDEDLVDALKRGVIAGAGLDVYRTEPLPPEHPFWDCPNLFLTSHQGGSNANYVDLALVAMKANMRAYLDGKPSGMVNVVRA